MREQREHVRQWLTFIRMTGCEYMSIIGQCFKCGCIREVRHHHYKGYGTDETLPYCRSCDAMAHNKARKTGKCQLTYNETQKLSHASANKCIKKKHLFHMAPETNAGIEIRLRYNTRTNNMVINTSRCIYNSQEMC